jgi:hypothetical protein
MNTEAAYLICDFVPIEELDGLASLSKDVFAGVKRYADHKEILSYILWDRTCIFAGYKRSHNVVKNNKYYGNADAIIECNGSVLIVEDDKIYTVGYDYDNPFNVTIFPQMTWGGCRKMDSNPGGSVKSIYYVTDIDCTLYYGEGDEEGDVYVRTDMYRGYTNDDENAEAGEMEDHSVRQYLVKVWDRR